MTLDELAASWDEKAAHWRRTAKQQRSACRTGDSTKVRLLEKAQLAEDCARELREVMAESAKLLGRSPIGVIVDDRAAPFRDSAGNFKLERLRAPPDNHQDTPVIKAKRRIGAASTDPTAKIEAFNADIERAATLVDSEARDSTVDSGSSLADRVFDQHADAFKALAESEATERLRPNHARQVEADRAEAGQKLQELGMMADVLAPQPHKGE